jgi:hypothetical protein
MKPNFFLIGAPKCGTTTVADWLSQNDQCFFSEIKEPHYYADKYVAKYNKNFNQKNKEEYLKLFEKSTENHIAIGEGSTHYLREEKSLQKIYNDNPNAKIIVCLRNPVDMARSLHSHLVWWGREQYEDFEKGWKMQNIRKTGKKILPWAYNPETLQYAEMCKTGTQIQKLVNIFPKEQIIFITIDEIKNHPQKTYEEICSFLKINQNQIIQKNIKNVSKIRKHHILNLILQAIASKKRLPSVVAKIINKINNKNTTLKKPKKINETEREILTRFFSEEVKLIEKITKKDLNNWKHNE